MALDRLPPPSVSGGVAFLPLLSFSLSGVYLAWPGGACLVGRSSGYGKGAVGGAVGGAGKDGMGGGLEKAGG